MIFSPERSVAVKLISSSIFSIIVCNLLAPMFSTVVFTSEAIFAIVSIPSSENSSSTFSVFNRATYCFIKLKSGSLKTDHILFIASGAFQLAKPSDLLPELQGRLPIRVELEALTSDDFKRILREPDFSLIKQYVALLKTENVELEFSDDGIDAIANIASEVNTTVENIGARRLHTIIEKILDEISFTATDRAGEKIIINKEYINRSLGDLVKDTDLSKFIL